MLSDNSLGTGGCGPSAVAMLHRMCEMFHNCSSHCVVTCLFIAVTFLFAPAPILPRGALEYTKRFEALSSKRTEVCKPNKLSSRAEAAGPWHLRVGGGSTKLHLQQQIIDLPSGCVTTTEIVRREMAREKICNIKFYPLRYIN